MTFTEEATEKVVHELTSMRRSFTGEDVHNRIHNKHIRRDDDFSACTSSAGTISVCTRKMFNQGHPVFSNYGSTIVPDGPVLYFPLPYHAKVRAKKIKEVMDTRD